MVVAGNTVTKIDWKEFESKLYTCYYVLHADGKMVLYKAQKELSLKEQQEIVRGDIKQVPFANEHLDSGNTPFHRRSNRRPTHLRVCLCVCPHGVLLSSGRKKLVLIVNKKVNLTGSQPNGLVTLLTGVDLYHGDAILMCVDVERDTKQPEAD